MDNEVFVGNDACIGGRSEYRDDAHTGDCAAAVVVVVFVFVFVVVVVVVVAVVVEAY